MGVPTFFIGYIEEAWPGLKSGGDVKLREQLEAMAGEINQHNEGVIKAVPVEDRFPPLCRGMFGWDEKKDAMISWRNRLIHFAACMKNADFCIRDWLDKFEVLLRGMYWESAYVRITCGYMGVFEFKWKPERKWVEDMCKGELRKITAWEFESTMAMEELEKLRETKSYSPPEKR